MLCHYADYFLLFLIIFDMNIFVKHLKRYLPIVFEQCLNAQAEMQGDYSVFVMFELSENFL